mmetsp:Transcript_14803/g.47198  ORF Transcript_14803/g.47198 Transcript_14803/m.47198 type:complete len:325 (+) Transcript_14803:218-1192(+)
MAARDAGEEAGHVPPPGVHRIHMVHEESCLSIAGGNEGHLALVLATLADHDVDQASLWVLDDGGHHLEPDAVRQLTLLVPQHRVKRLESRLHQLVGDEVPVLVQHHELDVDVAHIQRVHQPTGRLLVGRARAQHLLTQGRRVRAGVGKVQLLHAHALLQSLQCAGRGMQVELARRRGVQELLEVAQHILIRKFPLRLMGVDLECQDEVARVTTHAAQSCGRRPAVQLGEVSLPCVDVLQLRGQPQEFAHVVCRDLTLHTRWTPVDTLDLELGRLGAVRSGAVHLLRNPLLPALRAVAHHVVHLSVDFDLAVNILRARCLGRHLP